MTGSADFEVVCAEIDGLTVELTMHPAAKAFDRGIGDVIVAGTAAANDLAGPLHGVVTVLVDDDERIRRLNRDWRNIDRATNVLSFPSPDGPHGQAGSGRCFGDIAISYETTAREAATEGKPFAHHLAHLTVHGFLHLLGYDHETDADADEMERLERIILARLNVPDPYIARDAEH